MKYITCLLFVSLTWTGFAENVLIDFKQPGPPFPKATDRGKEKPSVQMKEGLLQLRAPNFWSSIVQLEGMNHPSGDIDPKATLQVSVKGSVIDEDPALVVVLFSADWQRASAYRVPLDGLSATELKTFAATTPFGEPMTSEKILKDKEPLRIGEQIGTVQIITKASKGNHAWDLDIAKISFK